MALELVGGAFVSATFQVLFERLASHDITDYFSSRKFKGDLLKNLRIKLISINKVVEDAEKKQFQDPYVKQWLDELKDAVYEADDLLDDIAIEAARQKQEADESEATTSKKVRNFFVSFVNSFDRETESRIKKVLDNFEFLAKQKYELGLQEGVSAGADYGFGGKWPKRLPTTSLVDESSIYGRNGDKEEVTKFLLSKNVGERQLSIISIVAMGGMGKTTLAQFVYNDERMNDEFQLKAWVCVSEDFDVVNVTKAIMRAFHISVNDSKDFNLLQLELKEELTGKRFLLFLDDVWDENHSNWEVLLVPFYTGALGSKILVTTRSQNVASAMHSTQMHLLQKLEEKDCWKLFTKYAFNDSNVGTNPDLETIGRKIVKKCKGLPLAVKTMGSLLHTQLPYQEWVKILKSEFWDLPENKSGIIPALKLSYHYLPSKLKRCFAYCSTFPKDFQIKKDVLIQLWMAEGLLQSCQRDICAEELGIEFFNELESRSFFQLSHGDGQHFIMHDLLNDLAKFVSGELCFRLEGDKVQDIAKKVRHFSYQPQTYDNLGIFKPLSKCPQLRSFISHFEIHSSFKGQPVQFININLIHDLVSRFKYLRVLSLSSYINLIELGDDIGNLKHLRSLDLSITHIRKLPDSICTLINLQTLKLNKCQHLTELPSDLHRLINLHHLEFYNSRIRKLSIKVGRLKHLRTLTSFSVSKHSGYSIKEMGQLKHLQGRLSILELENVIDPMDALEAKMKDKMNLDELELGWNKDNEDSETERRVLDAIQPHNNLKKLTITGYGGTRFPDWLGPHYLCNLASLMLRGSKHCFSLPPLGLLPCLKKLCISGLHAILDIGNEFYGNNSSTLPFRSLQELKFEDMEEWKEWLFFNCENEDEYFPCLQNLYMSNCPKLRSDLPHCLPSLRKLVIYHCPLLEASLPKAGTLETLKLRAYKHNSRNHDNRSFLDQLVFSEGYVKELGFTHSLRYLSFGGGHSSMPFSLDLFPNLSRLSLKNYPELVTFPEVRIVAPKLKDLYLCGLSNLKSLPENMHTLLPSIRYLLLRGCKQLESLPQGGLPVSIVWLKIQNCPKLIASSMEWGLQNLHSLSTFIISDDFENVESFLEKRLLPPNVKRLGFWNCSKLKSINYRGLLHLKSLQSLEIYDCPSLQCLPEEGLPKSLSALAIRCSPLLELRCQREKGQDWHKISHISHIVIGNNLIT